MKIKNSKGTLTLNILYSYDELSVYEYIGIYEYRYIHIPISVFNSYTKKVFFYVGPFLNIFKFKPLNFSKLNDSEKNKLRDMYAINTSIIEYVGETLNISNLFLYIKKKFF